MSRRRRRIHILLSDGPAAGELLLVSPLTETIHWPSRPNQPTPLVSATRLPIPKRLPELLTYHRTGRCHGITGAHIFSIHRTRITRANVVYTIGYRKAYNARLAQPEPMWKVGRTDDYPGGSVFRTAEDAADFLRCVVDGEDYSVYEVEADWETDTAPNQDGMFHDLLRDARIIREVELF